MKKRILSLLLVLALFLTLLPAAALAEGTVVASGNCGANGDNVTWTLFDNGELMIEGSGAMQDFLNVQYSYAPWHNYKNRIQKVMLSDSLTKIGNYAFYDCPYISSVIIPNSVTTIGSSAFGICSGLQKIVIPASVVSIGSSAFESCSGLVEAIIYGDVTVIEGRTFMGCSELAVVAFPGSVTEIDDYAFYGCYKLSEVNYCGTEPQWNAIHIVGTNNNPIKQATVHFFISSGICGNNLTYTLNQFGELVISGSGQMLSWMRADSVPWYSNRESIRKVTIENGVTGIGDYAFSGCSNLTSITIPDSVTSIGGYVFEKSGLTSITIPNSVTSIGYSAFNGCSSLTGITLPDSITGIGFSTFFGCSSLTSITIPESVTRIYNNAFHNCSSLTSITLPDGVTSIGDSAFECCYNLASITLPDAVTSIGGSAFFTCISLTSVTIPDSVTTIGQSAFYGCTSLNTVHYGGTRAQRSEREGNGWNSVGNDALFDAAWTYAPYVTGVALAEESLSLPIGETHQLIAALSPSDADDPGVRWTSSDETIATVDENGLVTALAVGSATITVTTNDGGFTAECAVTVYMPSPEIVSQPQNVTAIVGDTAVFSVTATGAESYQWQFRKSADSPWGSASADGNKTATLNVPVTANKNGYQYRCAVTNAGGTVYSDIVTLTLLPKPTITKQPVNASAPVGGTATFTVTAEGAESYQWQYRTSSAGNWANSPATGSTTATLKVSAVAHKSGYQYRCKVTNAAGTTVSSAAILTVTDAVKPTITAQPTNASVPVGGTATFSVTATDATRYQWQFRKTSSGAWANATASGNATATVKVPVTAAKNGYQYRCAVSNIAGTVYSNTVTLSILSKPTVTRQPTDAVAAAGGTAVFSVTATDATSYQWQYRKTSSGAWANATAPGNATATVKVPVTAAKNGYQYRCKVSNAAGTVYTNVVTLSVQDKPTIIKLPVDASAPVGGTAVFSVTAVGATGYQWQFRRSASGAWANAGAAGNATDTVTVPVTAAKNGYQYRCAVSNAAGMVYSNIVTLTVLSKPVITAQPMNASAPVGGTAVFSVTATGATGYQWQFRKSADGAWANASANGNQTATLNVPVTANKNGYQYRCAVTNAQGTVYTSIVTLSVG